MVRAAANPANSGPTRATTTTNTAGYCADRAPSPRIAQRGINRNERLGRYRWKIERTVASLTGYRRLTIRYERHGEHFAGFLHLTAALTCFKKLPTTLSVGPKRFRHCVP